MIKLTDQILFNLDQDEVTGMIFVDFGKAFYVVNHQLLLTKLRLYRVSDSALSFFTSYVTERKHFVTINGQKSDPLTITQGVLQARGGTPKKLGRGVRPASQNPDPIYDPNLRFSLPYL